MPSLPGRLGRRPAAPDPLDEPASAEERLAWRPQLPKVALVPPSVRDPIIEPHWQGIHVLAHFDSQQDDLGRPWLRLFDTDGEDATEEEPATAEALRRAFDCIDAVVEGFLTDQATRSGVGATVDQDVDFPKLGIVTGRRTEMVPRPLPDEGSPVGFVAVDLLRVDGQELFGVPLLERKRLLDGVIRENALVRITPFTRPPVAPWLTSWRASGFAGVVLKAANSRYQPSSLCHDWVVITKAEGR